MVLCREGLTIAKVWGIFDQWNEFDILFRHFEIHIHHRVEELLQPMCKVVKDELPVALNLLSGERYAMDETHLFENGRFSRVSGTKEEDLHLMGHFRLRLHSDINRG